MPLALEKRENFSVNQILKWNGRLRQTNFIHFTH